MSNQPSGDTSSNMDGPSTSSSWGVFSQPKPRVELEGGRKKRHSNDGQENTPRKKSNQSEISIQASGHVSSQRSGKPPSSNGTQSTAEETFSQEIAKVINALDKPRNEDLNVEDQIPANRRNEASFHVHLLKEAVNSTRKRKYDKDNSVEIKLIEYHLKRIKTEGDKLQLAKRILAAINCQSDENKSQILAFCFTQLESESSRITDQWMGMFCAIITAARGTGRTEKGFTARLVKKLFTTGIKWEGREEQLIYILQRINSAKRQVTILKHVEKVLHQLNAERIPGIAQDLSTTFPKHTDTQIKMWSKYFQTSKDEERKANASQVAEILATCCEHNNTVLGNVTRMIKTALTTSEVKANMCSFEMAVAAAAIRIPTIREGMISNILTAILASFQLSGLKSSSKWVAGALSTASPCSEADIKQKLVSVLSFGMGADICDIAVQMITLPTTTQKTSKKPDVTITVEHREKFARLGIEVLHHVIAKTPEIFMSVLEHLGPEKSPLYEEFFQKFLDLMFGDSSSCTEDLNVDTLIQNLPLSATTTAVISSVLRCGRATHSTGKVILNTVVSTPCTTTQVRKRVGAILVELLSSEDSVGDVGLSQLSMKRDQVLDDHLPVVIRAMDNLRNAFQSHLDFKESFYEGALKILAANKTTLEIICNHLINHTTEVLLTSAFGSVTLFADKFLRVENRENSKTPSILLLDNLGMLIRCIGGICRMGVELVGSSEVPKALEKLQELLQQLQTCVLRSKPFGSAQEFNEKSRKMKSSRAAKKLYDSTVGEICVGAIDAFIEITLLGNEPDHETCKKLQTRRVSLLAGIAVENRGSINSFGLYELHKILTSEKIDNTSKLKIGKMALKTVGRPWDKTEFTEPKKMSQFQMEILGFIWKVGGRQKEILTLLQTIKAKAPESVLFFLQSATGDRSNQQIDLLRNFFGSCRKLLEVSELHCETIIGVLSSVGGTLSASSDEDNEYAREVLLWLEGRMKCGNADKYTISYWLSMNSHVATSPLESALPYKSQLDTNQLLDMADNLMDSVRNVTKVWRHVAVGDEGDMPAGLVMVTDQIRHLFGHFEGLFESSVPDSHVNVIKKVCDLLVLTRTVHLLLRNVSKGLVVGTGSQQQPVDLLKTHYNSFIQSLSNYMDRLQSSSKTHPATKINLTLQKSLAKDIRVTSKAVHATVNAAVNKATTKRKREAGPEEQAPKTRKKKKT